MTISGENNQTPIAGVAKREEQTHEDIKPDAVKRPRKRKHHWLLPTLTALAGIAVGVGGTIGYQYAAPQIFGNPMLEAYQKCNLGKDTTAKLGTGQKSVTFTGVEKTTGVQCLLRNLDAPSSTNDRIAQTRALDGRQEVRWKSFEASWTYHPDDGLNLVVEPREN